MSNFLCFESLSNLANSFGLREKGRLRFPLLALLIGWISLLAGGGPTASATLQPPTNPEPTIAAGLFPQETQGLVCVRDVPKLVERWNKTQFGLLTHVEGMKRFWDEQQKEIESRLSDAGWNLNISPQDIYQVTTGEMAIGWVERRANTSKPYAIALAMMVKGKEAESIALLAKIDSELKAKKAVAEKVTIGNVSVTKYVMPKKVMDTVAYESLFVKNGDWIFAADEADVLGYMMAASQAAPVQSLVTTEDYKSALAHLASTDSPVDLEYFVRPLGFARVLRSMAKISVSPKKDMIRKLERQGFDSIPAACGRVSISPEGEFDVFHDCYVVSNSPKPRSVQILDFPNNSPQQVPAWASSNLSGVMSMAWNVRDAFWKVDGLVDDVADAKDTFKKMIRSIQNDPLGPQIDIENDVMPNLTNEIFTFSDCQLPINTDSKRTLIAVRITNHDKLAKLLNHVMKDEPDTEPVDFLGVRIWKKTNEENSDLKLELDDDGFRDLGSKPKKKVEEEDEEAKDPWLTKMSVAVYKDYFMFSSHAELIEQVISNERQPESMQRLDREGDFERVKKAIATLTDGKPNCVWQVDRSDKSFEMQYELFRQDKLPQSRSMLASLADRLLRPKDKVRNETQRVKGDSLPEFAKIKQYLMPSGLVIQTEDSGWAIRSFVLNKAAGTGSDSQTSTLTAERAEQTAEIKQSSNSDQSGSSIR